MDLRKIVEKHGQSQGYKSISIDHVPVSTVRNIIKRFTAHGTVANFPGHGRKSKITTKDCWNGGFRTQINFQTNSS